MPADLRIDPTEHTKEEMIQQKTEDILPEEEKIENKREEIERQVRKRVYLHYGKTAKRKKNKKGKIIAEICN